MISPCKTSRFSKAVEYAGQHHEGHMRKGESEPYLKHLVAVATIVVDAGGSEDQAIAAVLHDSVEHRPRSGRTRREIEQRFGDTVLAIVDACTDVRDEESRGRADWKQRKRILLERLPTLRPEARLVFLADKLDNARTLLEAYRKVGEKAWVRFAAPKSEVIWYYTSLANAACTYFPKDRLAQELARTVQKLLDAATPGDSIPVGPRQGVANSE